MPSASIATFPISYDFFPIIIFSFLVIFFPFLNEVNALISPSMLSSSHFIFFYVKLTFHVRFFIFIVIMLFVSFDLQLIVLHAYELIQLSYVLIILNVQLTVDFFTLLILSTFLLPPQRYFGLNEVIERLPDLLEVGEQAMELFFFL